MKSYPLQWPPGWRTTKPSNRKRAMFSKRIHKSSGTGDTYRSWSNKGEVSIAEGTRRVLGQMRALGVRDGDEIISTDLELRLDGLPRGAQKEPANPGVALYWKKGKDAQHKVIAVDLYDRIADNLAAIAATLDAMRAIERHGGAMILERAFLGFQCLPMPNTWRSCFAYSDDATPTIDEVKKVYRKKADLHHPDHGGSEAKMAELNWAMREAERELS